MNIKLQSQYLRTRSLLNKISDISFAYSSLNRQHPTESLTDEETKELITAYDQLLKDAKLFIDSYDTN